MRQTAIIHICAALTFGVTAATAHAERFDSSEYGEIAAKIVMLRLTNASCAKFGIQFSSEGLIFDEMVGQEQEKSLDLRLTIAAAANLVNEKFDQIGYPEYCSRVLKMYPEMLRSF
ncbi:hypothetical protein DEM27_05775 [Metarhizobium album]|uniref:Signal recognition particle n=1 Tax=Metarhizobium album TaxID=2182425 RepID=A0A2U2DVC3_9HYPH|nr:hypothetical protein [Rhizobium album]PWE57149.1 hypothetical protein DEM27_05775 [Rhizobium album]